MMTIYQMLTIYQMMTICQMMTIYFVWVQRINFSKTLSVLTTTLLFIISEYFLKTSSLRRTT